MGGVRRLIGWAFAGVMVCACLLLTAPAGGAAGPGSGWQPPPGEEPSPLPGDPLPPTLTVVPATASAGALVKVIGEGFLSCAAANAEVDSSRKGDLSLAAVGDVYLFWDGVGPVAITHLDEKFGFSVNLEIAQSTSPGDHRLVGRCVDNAGDEAGDDEGMGSTDFTVPPPPDVVAVVPGRNPVDGTAPSPTTSAADAALGAAGSPDGADMTENPETPETPSAAANPSAASDTDENEGNSAIAAEPAPAVTAPMSWGLLVGGLLLASAVVAVPLSIPSLIPLVLQARRGPKWVRTNVRATLGVAPAVGVELAPPIEDYWPPTPVVRFAMHADSGTQVLTEVKQ